MRYVVLDTLGDRDTAEIAGRRGTVLGRFRFGEVARSMVLRRLVHGYRGVVAMDAETGEVVCPEADVA